MRQDERPRFNSNQETSRVDAGTVDRVLTLVQGAEFKRHQAAPGLKVTDRAFGTGWLMPIAAKLT